MDIVLAKIFSLTLLDDFLIIPINSSHDLSLLVLKRDSDGKFHLLAKNSHI